jgi:hypothetical protein
MPSILIIWQESPGQTSLFLVPTSALTPQIQRYLNEAQNRYIDPQSAYEPSEGLAFLNGACTSEDHRIPTPKDLLIGDGLPRTFESRDDIQEIYLSGFA